MVTTTVAFPHIIDGQFHISLSLSSPKKNLSPKKAPPPFPNAQPNFKPAVAYIGF